MARVYISSTFSDLEEHRRTVGSALRRLGHEDVAMEYYVAEDKRPLDRCLSDVESCDVYVGIFAWRYGYIPNVNYPDGRSITELEYRKAREKGVPRLIFLLSEDALWPRSKQDKGAAADKIETLRQELASGHLVNMFESPDELARKVNEAIIAWEKKSGLVGKRQLTDWDAYRQAVYDKHQWVRLQVIAGASKERASRGSLLPRYFSLNWSHKGCPKPMCPMRYWSIRKRSLVVPSKSPKRCLHSKTAKQKCRKRQSSLSWRSPCSPLIPSSFWMFLVESPLKWF